MHPSPRAALLFLALLLASCRHAVQPPSSVPDDVAKAALALVEAARSQAGLGADHVDDGLVEKIRCLQLVRRLLMDTDDNKVLLGALHGEAGPDRQYPPEERPRRQHERASRGLRATLKGTCTATSWPDGLQPRIAFLTDFGASKVPDEVKRAAGELKGALSGAELARIRCSPGDVGFLLVRDGRGRRRLVDAFSLERSQVEIHPNEPTMK